MKYLKSTLSTLVMLAFLSLNAQLNFTPNNLANASSFSSTNHAIFPDKKFRKRILKPGTRPSTFGAGINPIFGIRNTERDNASKFKTTTSQVGFFLTGTLNPTPKIRAIIGIGTVTNTEKESWTAAGNPENETKTSGIAASIGIFYAFNAVTTEKRALDIGVGGTAIIRNGNVEVTNTRGGVVTNNTKDDFKSTNIGLAIRPEWFVNQHFSIHTQVGIAISLLNEDNSAFSEGGVNVHIFETGDLLGQAGFTFYF